MSISEMLTESQNIEFKESWHDEYQKWTCGFAVFLHPSSAMTFRAFGRSFKFEYGYSH